MPKISVVIVSWNVCELLRQNLAQLFALRHDDFPVEVFVVDNGSKDGSAHMVRDEFPWVHLVQNDYNAGFAKACNQAIRMAKGDVILLLNPDTRVESGTLELTHRQLMEHRDIGVFGVRLLDEKGDVVRSVRRDPTLRDQLAVFLKLPHFFPNINDRYLATDFDYAVSQDVEQIRGSYFAFRREILQYVGMLDERFFIWFEEVDFCRRVRGNDLRIRYCAEAVCRDFVGKSFAQVSVWKKQRMFFTSAWTFFWKWGFRSS